jgi:hypothetical protein
LPAVVVVAVSEFLARKLSLLAVVVVADTERRLEHQEEERVRNLR